MISAIIYTFNVKLHRDLKQEAKTSGVSVRYHNVIYRLQKDLKEEISQQLPMIEVEEEIGIILSDVTFNYSEIC